MAFSDSTMLEKEATYNTSIFKGCLLLVRQFTERGTITSGKEGPSLLEES
jgi:hypothetical protein